MAEEDTFVPPDEILPAHEQRKDGDPGDEDPSSLLAGPSAAQTKASMDRMSGKETTPDPEVLARLDAMIDKDKVDPELRADLDAAFPETDQSAPDQAKDDTNADPEVLARLDAMIDKDNVDPGLLADLDAAFPEKPESAES